MTDSMTAQANRLLLRFRSEFQKEIPTRIHNRDVADDGAPQWSPEFSRWLTAREVIDTPYPVVPTEEHRLRTTRALRKLRSASPRMFEVAYRQLVGGEPIKETAKWLNERALKNKIPLPPGKSVHYSDRDTVVILFCALHMMEYYY